MLVKKLYCTMLAVWLVVLGATCALAQPHPIQPIMPGPPPTNITATMIQTTASLMWEAVPEASGYYLYRAPEANASYGSLTQAPITATTFKDRGLAPGTAYWWIVTAIYSDGRMGSSAPVSFTTPAAVNPTGFTATRGPGDDVTLQWDVAPGAAFYWLQGGGVPAQQVQATTYTVKNLQPGTHSYALIAYYNNGEGGPNFGDENNPVWTSVRVYPTFRVMSANIWLGGTADLPGLDRLACYLSNADIAFLQEVDKSMNRSGGINEAEVLAQKSGLTNFYFVKNRDRDGGEHGIAVLSRFPLGPLTAHETRGTDAPNHILQTVADVYGTPINLFANHYLAGDDENAKTGRLEASTRAVELLDQVTGSVIFGGDLNAEPERLEIQLLTSKLSDAWYAAPQDRHFCGGGLKRIDYIFFRGPYVVRQFEAPCLPLHESFLPKYEKPNCSLADADLSDHSFVLVKFEIVSN